MQFDRIDEQFFGCYCCGTIFLAKTAQSGKNLEKMAHTPTPLGLQLLLLLVTDNIAPSEQCC